jgi:hypothetical protein
LIFRKSTFGHRPNTPLCVVPDVFGGLPSSRVANRPGGNIVNSFGLDEQTSDEYDLPVKEYYQLDLNVRSDLPWFLRALKVRAIGPTLRNLLFLCESYK